MQENRTFRFRLVGDYMLDITLEASDLSAAKDMIRREQVPAGVLTPQELGRRFQQRQEGWAPDGVDSYLSALTDVGPDAAVYSQDYGCVLLVRELPAGEGPEQTFRFKLETEDSEPRTAVVTATSLYAAIDQILDGAVQFEGGDDEFPVMDEEVALFAMLTTEQSSYENYVLGRTTVSWQVVTE